MIKFIRTALRGFFRIALFAGVTALIAAFIASNLATAANMTTVFAVAWAIIALLFFAFPEIWKFLNTPM